MSPPPDDDTVALHWWRTGAEDEAHARNEGLDRGTRELRDCAEALGRSHNHRTAADVATSLAVIFMSDQPRQARFRLAWRLIRNH